MSGWAQREAEEREDRAEAVIELDAMLNEAQEVAGVDSHEALMEWIRAQQWRPIDTAPKYERIELWGRYPFFSHIAENGECWDCGALMDPTHWRPLPEGPK